MLELFVGGLGESRRHGYHTYPRVPLGALVDARLARPVTARAAPSFAAPASRRGVRSATRERFVAGVKRLTARKG